MSSEFKASRITREFSHQVQAPPEQVFPLLCPVREHDWIPYWECQLVYSASGKAEDGCVFCTDLPDHGRAIWTVSRYEPPRRIQFVVTYPASHVEKLEIDNHNLRAQTADLGDGHACRGRLSGA